MGDVGDYLVVYEVSMYETSPWCLITKRIFYNGLDAYAVRDALQKELKDNNIATVYVCVGEKKVEKKATPEIIEDMLGYV